MTSITRTRILLIALFLFPLLVMALFWLFGRRDAERLLDDKHTETF